MTDITETRKLSVQNVIVHISDVQRLARLFPQNSDNKTSIDRKVILCFTTKFFDGTKRSSKQSNIFSEDFPKRVREIEMSYWVYGNDDKIYIRLSHGSYLIWDSYVEISGQDSTWVNGTLKKIDDIISNMEPQPQ